MLRHPPHRGEAPPAPPSGAPLRDDAHLDRPGVDRGRALSRLGPGDAVFSTHRCHGHFLAVRRRSRRVPRRADGARPTASAAAAAAASTCMRPASSRPGSRASSCRSRSGSRSPGSCAARTGIAVVFIGDGTLGQGAFYESMNLASLWGVRLLIVLEDNQIAQTTPSSVGVAGDILARAEAFGIDAAALDGADAPALQQDFAALVDDDARPRGARSSGSSRTVRLGPHSKRDDERSEEEMAELHTPRPGHPACGRTRPGRRRARPTRDAARACSTRRSPGREASPEPDQLAHLGDVYPPLDEAAAVRPWARPADEPRVVESLNAALHDLFERDPARARLRPGPDSTRTAARSRSRRASRRDFPDRVAPDADQRGRDHRQRHRLRARGRQGGRGDHVRRLRRARRRPAREQRREAPLPLARRGRRSTSPSRVPMGGGRGYGPTHSQSLEKMFFGIPGLRVVAVSSFTDPYALLWNAVAADPGPVLFVENKAVYAERVRQPVDGLVEHFPARTTRRRLPERPAQPDRLRRPRPDRDHLRPLRVARVGARCGSSSSSARSPPTSASSRSSRRSISTGSSRRRSRSECVVTVEEAPGEAGFGAEVAARLAEAGFRGRFVADRGRGVADPGREEPRGRRAARPSSRSGASSSGWRSRRAPSPPGG